MIDCRHVLKALRPDAEAVPRPSRQPGSAGASPAVLAPPPGAAAAVAAATTAPPPAFVLPPDDSDTGGGDAEPGGTQAAAGADGAAGAAGGGEQEEAGPLSKEEDERQLNECFEVCGFALGVDPGMHASRTSAGRVRLAPTLVLLRTCTSGVARCRAGC